MQRFTIRRLLVTAVAVGVLGSASPAFASQPAAGSVGRADQKTPAWPDRQRPQPRLRL
jgi:hypothetical protein